MIFYDLQSHKNKAVCYRNSSQVISVTSLLTHLRYSRNQTTVHNHSTVCESLPTEGNTEGNTNSKQFNITDKQN